MKAQYTYEVEPTGYTIFRNGKPVYSAGNHPNDSQVYIDADDPIALPRNTLKRYAQSTMNELIQEGR